MKIEFMKRAIELSKLGMEKNAGGPFGAVIVKDGIIVGEGHNCVVKNNDPTAHAEVIAIRDACKNLGSFQLTDCEIYCSCEPCPMCLSAIYWARPSKIYFANTKEDAAEIHFDDKYIYEEIKLNKNQRKIPMEGMLREEAREIFNLWLDKPDKIDY